MLARFVHTPYHPHSNIVLEAETEQERTLLRNFTSGHDGKNRFTLHSYGGSQSQWSMCFGWTSAAYVAEQRRERMWYSRAWRAIKRLTKLRVSVRVSE